VEEGLRIAVKGTSGNGVVGMLGVVVTGTPLAVVDMFLCATTASVIRLKTLKNNRMLLLMVILPLFMVEKLYSSSCAVLAAIATRSPLSHQASLSFAYPSRPLLKRGLSGSVSRYLKFVPAALRTPKIKTSRARLNCQLTPASTWLKLS